MIFWAGQFSYLNSKENIRLKRLGEYLGNSPGRLWIYKGQIAIEMKQSVFGLDCITCQKFTKKCSVEQVQIYY